MADGVQPADVLPGHRVVLRRAGAEGDGALLDGLFAVPEVAELWPGDNSDHLHEPGTVGFTVWVGDGFIGFIQYWEEPAPEYRHAGIDVVLHPDWCNQGLGTDAVRTLARHLFDDLGHHRIVIDPRVENRRAIASYRKVGFRDVGIMRRYERGNDGVLRDGLLMDLLPEELTRGSDGR
ncbi:MAG: GNAT family N-acetyltransferase [Acidimicrobiales bacterium]